VDDEDVLPPHRRHPPEEGRPPQTEKEIANDVVFGVVAVELLSKFDRLDEEVGRAFERAVYETVMQRLRHYADPDAPEARKVLTNTWRLQDNVLERQFSLSSWYCDRAAKHLDMFDWGERRKEAAQLAIRRTITQHGVPYTDDPVSSNLIAWQAHEIWVGDSDKPAEQVRTRPFGYAMSKPEPDEWLLPVFVEHDRSSHAERMAMLAVGESVKAAGGKLHPDSKVRGVSAIYAAHTPCISCLTCFCQFKQRLPNVRLYFYFDTWENTRRWVDYSGVKESRRGHYLDDDEDLDALKERGAAAKAGSGAGADGGGGEDSTGDAGEA